MANRGLGHSPFGAGIVRGTETALRTSALRQLRDQEHNLNMQLNRANLANERQQKAGDQAALRALVGDVGNVAADVITGDNSTQPGIRKIREMLGMPNATLAGEEALAGDVQSVLEQLRAEHGGELAPAPKRETTGIDKDPTEWGAGGGLPNPAPNLDSSTGKDDTEFGHPESVIPRPDYIPQGMNQTEEIDLMELDLPMSEDMFELASNTGSNANMIAIEGTDLAVPADSSFGKVYQKYKPRFDLLADQLSGGLMEFIEAFSMPAQVLDQLQGASQGTSSRTQSRQPLHNFTKQGLTIGDIEAVEQQVAQLDPLVFSDADKNLLMDYMDGNVVTGGASISRIEQVLEKVRRHQPSLLNQLSLQ